MAGDARRRQQLDRLVYRFKTLWQENATSGYHSGGTVRKRSHHSGSLPFREPVVVGEDLQEALPAKSLR